jgi:hypothetical protein
MNTFRAVLIASVTAFAAACSTAPTKPAAAPAPAAKAAAPAAAVTNLAGVWTLTTESQMGSQDAKLTVAQTGKDIKGTMETPMGSVDYTGTVEGKDVKFGFNFNAQGTDLRIDYIGTVEGGTMKGKAVFGSFGEGTFTGKKQ